MLKYNLDISWNGENTFFQTLYLFVGLTIYFCTFNDHISFSQTKIMITFLKHLKIQFGMHIRYSHPLLFADLPLYSGWEFAKLLIQICNFGP